MAVAKMKKIGIFGYLAEMNAVIDSLQSLGAMHVSPAKDGLKTSEPEALRTIQRIERAFETLKSIHSDNPKKLKVKSIVDFTETYDWEVVVSRVESLKSNIDGFHRYIITTERLLHELSPYLPLEISLQDIEKLNRTKAFIGQVSVGQWVGLKEVLEKEVPLSTLAVIDDKGSDIYFSLFIHNDAFQAVENILGKHEFSHIDPILCNDQPANIHKEKTQELEETRTKLEKAEIELKEIAQENISSLLGIIDHLKVVSQQQKVAGLTLSSSKVFYLIGWVKENDVEMVTKKITIKFPITEIKEISPDEGEVPPVALSNPRWLEPFEILTNMYGRPRLGMVDPTPWTGPFFALFFAFCMTDAGYGLTLAIFSSLALIFKGKELPRATKNFLILILYVGVLTIFAGIIAGSYFGFNPSNVENPGSLVNLMLKFKLFDPLEDALLFFSISVVFGMIQIALGFGLSAYVKIKDAANAILKAKEFVLGFSWIIISLGLGVFIIFNLEPTLVESINPIAIKAIFIGMIGIVFGSVVLGIAGGEGVISAIGSAVGFDGLYGITGLFGDILSYARILALGISTGVIAGVINSLGGMLAGGSIILGIVAGIFLVAGHLGYTALSTLSAFIHPLRLQYVEYFGKFYEAGGNEFTPIDKKYDNIEIEKTT